MDWKWLFIYPDRQVAAVNELVIPAGVPVRFTLTSASVMNAFFIPGLGSMLYSMNGMASELNLQADAPGTFQGRSTHYSGAGFSDMAFSVRAVPAEEFAGWLDQTAAALPGRRSTQRAMRSSPSRAATSPRSPTARWIPGCFIGSSCRTCRPDPGRRSRPILAPPGERGTRMLGKLSWAAIPLDQPIPLAASAVVGVVILAVLVLVTLKGWVPYLWREWITSVDHKRIGVMYCVLALVMLLRGFIDAIMMRSQQALAFRSEGFLPPEHYDQIFSAHGTLMIFFVAMPFMIGLMNFVVPLQLGVRDVAFPTLNSVGFWLTATGALLVNVSLVVGEFARTGWLPYPPLSELAYSPGVGVDYYLWAVQISGVGTLLTGVNFVTTILKLRAPGMTLFRMPMFCWTALATNLLIVAAFPILTATLAMLTTRPICRISFLHQ